MSSKSEAQAGPDEELFPYPGKIKSRVWDYFRFRKIKEGPATKSNLDMTAVVCVLCKKTYANKGNTTNLQSHLDNQHKTVSTAVNKQPSVSQPRIDQFRIGNNNNTVPARLSKPQQDKIDDALMQMMVSKILPLSMVENEKFLQFVSLLDSRYKVPSRRTLLKGLEKKMTEIESKIKADLAECHDMAITHDGWTSCNTESYSTVTGHYIDKDWNLKSVSLSTAKVEGSHTSENIAKEIEKVKTDWNLPNCIAVSDNAANEKKAFDLLKWVRFGCYGHRINLVVRHSLSEPTVSRLIGKGRKLVTFFHQSSSANDLLMGKQKLLMSDQTPLKLILDVVTRWNSTYTMLERINKLVPAIVATANDPLMSKSASTSIKTFSFSFEEQSLSEKLVCLLGPFQKATESVSSETNPTMHKVLPILLALDKCITANGDDPPSVAAVKETMKQELEKRTQDTDLALLACALNPFTKNLRFLEDSLQEKAQGLLEQQCLELYCELGSCVKVKQEPKEEAGPSIAEDSTPDLPALPKLPADPEESDNGQLVTEAIEKPSSPKKIKVESTSLPNMDDWLNDVIFVGASSESADDVIKLEVSRYLGSSISNEEKSLTILQWWKQNQVFYPRLSVVAKKYLCIPASSIPSERIFSLCGTLVSKKRSRLSPSHIGLLVFLNRNLNRFW